jgi:L-fucose mutarotase/ribose pyranase (RbsD/FucU family)
MLFNIDNALNAEVSVKVRQGHGDEIVVCDTNFPPIWWPSRRCMGHSCAWKI